MKSIRISFLLLFVCLPILHAEDKGDAFGLLGVSWSHNDESNLGSGIDFGGGVRVRASGRIGFQIAIDRAQFSRDFSSGVHFEGTATTFGGDVQFYFPGANVEPYVFGGAGVLRFEETDRFPAEVDEDIFKLNQNAFTIQFGGGARIPLTPYLCLRPEFRWSFNDVSFVNQLRASAAVGYEW